MIISSNDHSDTTQMILFTSLNDVTLEEDKLKVLRVLFSGFTCSTTREMEVRVQDEVSQKKILPFAHVPHSV